MELFIRDAVAHDVPELKGVFRKASLSNENDRDVLLKHLDALEYSGAMLGVGRVRVGTVAPDGIVGFATTLDVEGRLELEDLFVDPDWMRRGVGRALVADAVQFASEKGIARIEVRGNAHALAFYRDVGFLDDGPVTTELGSGRRLHLDVS